MNVVGGGNTILHSVEVDPLSVAVDRRTDGIPRASGGMADPDDVHENVELLRQLRVDVYVHHCRERRSSLAEVVAIMERVATFFRLMFP